MESTKIGRTGLGYIKRRERFNNEKQQKCQEKVKAFINTKAVSSQSNNSGLMPGLY